MPLHLSLLILHCPLFTSPLLSSLVFPQGSKHRQLLATLRALEAAALPQQSPSLPGSDSEEEVVERKKKHSKKSSFSNVSIEVEKKRKKKCQKQGPPGSDSEEKEVERKKKCLKGVFNASDSAEEEKRKRKHQKQVRSNPAQHLDNDDQTGTNGYVHVWGTGRGISVS